MSSMRLALKLSMDAASSSNINHDQEKESKKKDDKKSSSSIASSSSTSTAAASSITKDNDNHDIKESKNNNKNDHKEKKEKAEKAEKVDKNDKPDKNDKKVDHKSDQNNNANKRKRAESDTDTVAHQPKSSQKRSMSVDQIVEEETVTKDIPNKKKITTEKLGIKSNNSSSSNIEDNAKKKQSNEEVIKKPKIEKEKKVKLTQIVEISTIPTNDEENEVDNKTDLVEGNLAMETPNDKVKAKKKKVQNAVLEFPQLGVPAEAEKEETAENTPRYQSNRAAAIVAKTKLSITGGGTRSPRADTEEEEKEKKKKSSEEVTTTADEVDDAKWVQCDTCSKWRCLPSHVDTSNLPEQWYCNMNIWDEASNNCDAPEINGNEVSGDANDSKDDARSKGGRWAGHVSKPKRQQIKTGPEEEEVMSAKKKGSRQPPQVQQQKSVLDKVDWVQCNKCNKWRKVPMAVDVGSLPEEWFCSLNTWNPMVARCTAKEEVDSLPIEDDIDRSAAKSKKASNPINTPIPLTSATGDNVKKVTQWVQCERRNCKKWRKVPAHVDMESLPEKWYCEMNVWDSERGSCDDPEPADSEDEKQQIASDRAQLLFANSKGPGALSYRRIIFGTDGKIRSSYNEKNKSVYGLFSFTEVHKQVDNEDYIEPSRRLSYWSSNAYDSSTVTKNEVQVPKKDKDKKDKDKDKEVEKEKNSVPIVNHNFKIQQEPTILLDCIRKLNGSNLALSTNCYQGSKSFKSNNFSLFDRFSYECKVVRSILLTSSTKKLPFNSLVDYIATSNFLNAEEEACRRSMNVYDIKAAVRRLELQGELEVSLNGNGEILIQSLKPCRTAGDPWSETKWSDKGLPLRLRKGKDHIKAFKDDLKREEDEKKRKRRREVEEEERVEDKEKLEIEETLEVEEKLEERVEDKKIEEEKIEEKLERNDDELPVEMISENSQVGIDSEMDIDASV